MSPAKKPRKATAKKPIKPVLKVGEKGKRVPFEMTEAKHAVGKALVKAIKKFGGNKGKLSEYLGMNQSNLSRVLRMSRDYDAGKVDKVLWPAEYVLPLARVSGASPHELAPEVYEPHMRVKRVKVDAGATLQ
jgi:hypothetical protein